MKRHESIIALSREHHFGLLFCWKIRQGLKKQVDMKRMQAYVQYFWNNHLQGHFEEEEALLFTALKDSLCEQAIREHIHIRQLVAAVAWAEIAQGDELNLLVDSIDNHIRFEERRLFPHIEKELPAEVLITIGISLQQSHQEPVNDNYPDEFWV